MALPERRHPHGALRRDGPERADAVAMSSASRQRSPSSASTSSGRAPATSSIRRRWRSSRSSRCSTRARAGGARCPRSRRPFRCCSSSPASSLRTASTGCRWCWRFSAPTTCCSRSTAFVSDPAWVSEVFRAPDLEAVLFFAFFILTDPPTSPIKYGDQILFAVLVAVVSFAIFEWLGAVYYLLAGVLVANVWEAWRRVTRRTGHTFPRGVGGFLREITPWHAR